MVRWIACVLTLFLMILGTSSAEAQRTSLASLLARIDMLEAKVAQLESENASSAADILNLQTEVFANANAIDSQQDSLFDLENDLDVQEAAIGAQQGDLFDLVSALDVQQAAIDAQETEVETLSVDVATQEIAVQTLIVDVATQELVVEANAEELLFQQLEVDTLVAEIEAQELDLTELGIDLTEEGLEREAESGLVTSATFEAESREAARSALVEATARLSEVEATATAAPSESVDASSALLTIQALRQDVTSEIALITLCTDPLETTTFATEATDARNVTNGWIAQFAVLAAAIDARLFQAQAIAMSPNPVQLSSVAGNMAKQNITELARQLESPVLKQSDDSFEAFQTAMRSELNSRGYDAVGSEVEKGRRDLERCASIKGLAIQRVDYLIALIHEGTMDLFREL